MKILAKYYFGSDSVFLVITGSCWKLTFWSNRESHLNCTWTMYPSTLDFQFYLQLRFLSFCRSIFLVPLLVAIWLRSLQKWPTKVQEFTLWYYVMLLLIHQSFSKQQLQPRKLMGQKCMYMYCTSNKPTSELISYFI